MGKRTIWAGIIVCALLAFGLGLFLNGGGRAAAAPNKTIAKDFEAKDLDGKTVRLSDFRGKFVIVNFWTTWCSYCVREFPSMQSMSQDHPEIVILAVNAGEPEKMVKKFAEDKKYGFTFLLDSDKKATSAYRIMYLPTTFFVNKDGEIVHHLTGGVEWDSPKMKEIVENFLKNELP